MLERALDLLFPPQCLNCNAQVPTNGTLCLPCWQKIRFITDPLCHACGLPFDYDLGPEALCADCLRERPAYAHARAVFRYDDASRALVTKLKYSDQTQLAAVYGTWLAKTGKELILASDAIIPVPLHRWRFIKRRYNQSALLARALAEKSALPWLPDTLQRTRPTPQQTGLTRKQRHDNVRNAFTVSTKMRANIKGKTLLLIDDVMTTGATLDACCQTLLKAGAMQVNVLTLARTAN